MPTKILVADDEEKIAKMVGSYLEAAGFSILLAFDGGKALELWKEVAPDSLVLDINMPLRSGLDVAREVRRTSEVPIIFLTAKADEIDRVIGLELGADDYVTKPFSPRELVARVRAVLRRAAPAARPTEADPRSVPTTIKRGDLGLDFRKRSASVGTRPVTLTTTQFDILALLMGDPGRVWTRLEILDRAVGESFEGYERTIDAHIKNIRKALGDDSEAARYIGTVRGVGYKFIERAE
jgi:DNA-binding response OmpR family regulator